MVFCLRALHCSSVWQVRLSTSNGKGEPLGPTPSGQALDVRTRDSGDAGSEALSGEQTRDEDEEVDPGQWMKV